MATALLLATACALETWAVLAVPVLLLALPPWRARVRAGAIWAVFTTAVWAPFILSGQFRMLAMTWTTFRPTAITALWGNAATVTWEIRATQAVVVVAASVVTWLFGRTTTDAATVAVAVVAWTRVVTDIQTFPYYRLSIIATTVAVMLAAAAHYLRMRNSRTLPALGISGLMLPLAASEALTIPILPNNVLHTSVLAGLVFTARAIPASRPPLT